MYESSVFSVGVQYSVVWLYYNFLFFCWWTLGGVFLGFGLLWIKQLWTFLYRFLSWTHALIFLWYIFRGGIVRLKNRHTFNFIRNFQQISEVTVSFCILTSKCMRVAVALHPCEHCIVGFLSLATLVEKHLWHVCLREVGSWAESSKQKNGALISVTAMRVESWWVSVFVLIMNRFKGLDLIDRVPDELWNEVRDIVQETGIKTIPMEKKCKKAK